MIDTGIRMRENVDDSPLHRECNGPLRLLYVLEISNMSEFIIYY